MTLPGCDELEEGLHVALLRPADVAGREVAAALLVVAVVAPGPVRARHAQLELLLVHRRAVDVDRRLADDDDPAAVAREADGQLERVGRGRRGAEEHRVEAEPAGGRPHGVLEPGVVAAQRGHPGAARELDGGIVEVDADHPAARREQDARRELADEAEPDHADPLADARLGLADAVQRDRADGGVGRVVETDARRHVDDEVLRHGDDLGVVRPAATAAGDPVAGRDPLDAGPDLEHDAGGRVAERASAESRSRATPIAAPTPSTRARSTTFLTRSGRARAFWRRFFSPVSTLVRSVPALISEKRLATRSQPGAERGRRDIDDADGAVTRGLRDLFHVVISIKTFATLKLSHTR